MVSSRSVWNIGMSYILMSDVRAEFPKTWNLQRAYANSSSVLSITNRWAHAFIRTMKLTALHRDHDQIALRWNRGQDVGIEKHCSQIISRKALLSDHVSRQNPDVFTGQTGSKVIHPTSRFSASEFLGAESLHLICARGAQRGLFHVESLY